MILIDNARQVLRHAWSVRLNIATVFFLVLDLISQVLPFLSGALPDRIFTAAAAVCGAAAAIARFLKQQNILPKDPL